MPKTTINEIDNSRFVASNTTAPMVVVVPGTASFGPVVMETQMVETERTFVFTDVDIPIFYGGDSLTNFLLQYGTTAAKKYSENGKASTLEGDYSFEYTTNLIRSGAAVMFMRLNEGETSKYSFSENESDTDAPEIQAKYSGSFGNRICCKFALLPNSETDAYVSIYISDFEFTSERQATLDMIKNWNEIFFTRVSTDPDSNYYVNQTLNLDYITFGPKELNTIIEELSSTDTGAKVYTLLGGKDFNENEDRDSILSKLYDNSTNTSVFDNFYDPYLFDFDFVTCGGITFSTSVADEAKMEKCHKAMISLCERRGDCVALLDTPQSFVHTELVSYVKQFDSSYAAFYAPWCSFVSATSGKIIFMPPSLIFMKSVLYNMAIETDPQLWYIPAGVNRTSAPFIIEPMYSIGSTILDEFQNNSNNLVKINPIMKVKNYGYCVYGNSTAMKQISPKSHSALESMNVRLISNVIKKYIFEICCGLSFEYNNSELWLKFYSQMDEKLLYMKRHYGLYDYRIIMDTSTVTQEAVNNRRVPGKVMISPNLAGEYFDIDFEIFPSGVTFGREE